MKKKLLYTLLALLLIANVILLVLIIKDSKRGDGGKGHPKPHFLVEELNFSEQQREQFFILDNEHRGNMIQIDNQMKELKDQLFNSLSNEAVSQDSLTHKIGELTSKRELEIFEFFKKVRKICTSEQEKLLDQIIKKALNKSGAKPPKHHNKKPPPPRDF